MHELVRGNRLREIECKRPNLVRFLVHFIASEDNLDILYTDHCWVWIIYIHFIQPIVEVIGPMSHSPDTKTPFNLKNSKKPLVVGWSNVLRCYCKEKGYCIHWW